MPAHTKVFQLEKAIVKVEYTRIPGKAELEQACITFLNQAERDRTKYREREKRTSQNAAYE